MHIIQIPQGDYDRDKFEEFCKHFGCTLLKNKRGESGFKISSDDPVNFFWLGANLHLKIDTPLAISVSSKIFGNE